MITKNKIGKTNLEISQLGMGKIRRKFEPNSGFGLRGIKYG